MLSSEMFGSKETFPKKFSERAQAREVAAKLKLKSSPMLRVLAAIHTWRDMDGSKSATMFMFFETSIIRGVLQHRASQS